MRRVLVEVTAADIAAGEQGRCLECPIALAISRAMGQPCGTNGYMWFTQEGRKDGMLPLSAKSWIIGFDFDCSSAVKPFSFEIEYREAA